MITTKKGVTSVEGTGYEILADLFCLIYALKKSGDIPFPFILTVILEAVESDTGVPEGLNTLLDIGQGDERGLPN